MFRKETLAEDMSYFIDQCTDRRSWLRTVRDRLESVISINYNLITGTADGYWEYEDEDIEKTEEVLYCMKSIVTALAAFGHRQGWSYDADESYVALYGHPRAV